MIDRSGAQEKDIGSRLAMEEDETRLLNLRLFRHWPRLQIHLCLL